MLVGAVKEGKLTALAGKWQGGGASTGGGVDMKMKENFQTRNIA